MTSAPASVPDTFSLPDLAGHPLSRIRGEREHAYVITNAAAQTLTANLLLAAGGVPSLTVASVEVPDVTSRSAAFLVNLGTLDADRRAAIPQATAHAHAKPLVLDPVFTDASPTRLTFARTCLAGSPHVLRCDAGEFTAPAGAYATSETVQAFAKAHGKIVALTGALDLIADGARIIRVENGQSLMNRVTAMGCAGTALVAAFTALHSSAPEAAAAAYARHARRRRDHCTRREGPGMFHPAFLYALFTPDTPTLITHGRIS